MVLTEEQNLLPGCAEIILGCGYTFFNKYGRVHTCLPLLHVFPMTLKIGSSAQASYSHLCVLHALVVPRLLGSGRIGCSLGISS